MRETVMKEYKLKFEMIPEECWRGNLRTLLPPQLWDVIRKEAYARSGHRCAVCGATGRLEAHERWSYDEKKRLQKLETVVALCKNCHEVVHISRTYLFGRGAEAEEHFKKVNGCSQVEYHAALAEANEAYQKRNQIEGWTTDFSWLNRYGY
jgi:hypothetical protein